MTYDLSECNKSEEYPAKYFFINCSSPQMSTLGPINGVINLLVHDNFGTKLCYTLLPISTLIRNINKKINKICFPIQDLISHISL